MTPGCSWRHSPKSGMGGIRASARSGVGTGSRSARSFAYPGEIRKVIYTTNAVESLNMSLRKVIKTRGSFPNEEAALKLLFLALERGGRRWTRSVQDWKAALNRFAILYDDCLPRGVIGRDSEPSQTADRRGDVF